MVHFKYVLQLVDAEKDKTMPAEASYKLVFDDMNFLQYPDSITNI